MEGEGKGERGYDYVYERSLFENRKKNSKYHKQQNSKNDNGNIKGVLYPEMLEFFF